MKKVFGVGILLAVLLAVSVVLWNARRSRGPDPAAQASEVTASAREEDRETLTVCGVLCDSRTSELTVVDASVSELREALPQLPHLRELTLAGSPMPIEDLSELREDFPRLILHGTAEFHGEAYDLDRDSLDFSAKDLDAQSLNRWLPLFRRLTLLNLTDTSLTDAELLDLIEAYPQVFILCRLPLAGGRYLTDSVEVDASGTPISVEQTKKELRGFPKLRKLILSDCGIDDETMEDWNRQNPDLELVWTVKVGLLRVRTDAIYFYPTAQGYLPKNEELKNLRFCHNMIAVDIGHIHATACDWVAAMPHLRYLILADSAISDLSPLSELKELVYLELFNMPIRDYSPLLGCTALEDLNVSNTWADPAPLAQMTWLHTLMWYGGLDHPDIREAVKQLPEQLSDTVVVLDSYHYIGAPWRYVANYYVFRDIIGGGFYNQSRIGRFWGEDGEKIMACKSPELFAGDVLAEIVEYRIQNGMEIPGIRDVHSPKAQTLLENLRNSRPA